MKAILFLLAAFAAASPIQAQKAPATDQPLPHYKPLPAQLLVKPPADYRMWDSITSGEDPYIYFIGEAPSYTYYVLPEKQDEYDSSAFVMIRCSNYRYNSAPTQELETAQRLFNSVQWDSIEYLTPQKGSLAVQHKRNVSLGEDAQLIKATKGDRSVELSLVWIKEVPYYHVFSVMR